MENTPQQPEAEIYYNKKKLYFSNFSHKKNLFFKIVSDMWKRKGQICYYY